MKSILEQLSSMTVVVADTGDLDSIKKFQPRDATTKPSLILAAAKNPDYVKLIDKALESSENALPQGFSEIELIKETVDQVSVFFGKEILKIISGRVSTEVDARLSFDTEATVEKARKLINLYKNFGIEKERILIKIAATWEGIKAAEILEKEGIKCNLTLLFNFCQAVTCANAKITLISPFVGRILDWHKAKTGKTSFVGAEDPGVISVTQIYKYFKEDNLMFEKITIIGCGLIGSSIFKALKKKSSIKKIITFDNNKSAMEVIKKDNLSDKIVSSSAEAVKNSDLVLFDLKRIKTHFLSKVL